MIQTGRLRTSLFSSDGFAGAVATSVGRERSICPRCDWPQPLTAADA